MKKFLAVFALLSVFMGVKAEWVQDYKADYSTYKGFPFYVMGYVPEWFDGVMTDFGANYKYVEAKEDAEETSDVTVQTNSGVEYYKIEVPDGAWHQYFIADGIPTELDGAYTVKALVRASAACTINVNMGWGWGDGQQVGASVNIPAGEEFQEIEWEYSGIGGTSCNLVAQPGMVTATIEWKWVTVSHNQKETRPVEWIENLVNGDAEMSWAEMGLEGTRYNDMDNNYKICAWGKEKGRNMNDDGGWDPFPCDIEEVDGSHVFVVHGQIADTEGDASAWDNQFWIESPREWKSGTALQIKFRYKASKDVKVATQCHYQQPSNYLIWHAIGDIDFTTEWKEFEGTMNIADDMNGTWGIAFQLNQNDKEAINFYFDNLSWSNMKLDEGYFVAGSNPNAGLEYDFDNAVQFEYDDANSCWVATVGEKNAYVSQIMISTVRGNDAAFKGATLKPTGSIKNDPDEWLDYNESSLAKLNLPGEGIWKIYLDDNYRAMAFEMIEGNVIEPIVINPNPTEIVINALERDYLTADSDGNPREEQIGEGQPWDNQFWIVANRTLSTGEVTVVEFDYVATAEAKSTTQLHSTPGNYLHWSAIGDVNFTTEEQHFEKTFTVPAEANDMQSIAFNLAEIKAANTYTIKNVVWRLEDSTESLINQTGGENFFAKVVGGSIDPIETAISKVAVEKSSNAATYNLAGQRVNKTYKGIVVKDGKKMLKK